MLKYVKFLASCPEFISSAEIDFSFFLIISITHKFLISKLEDENEVFIQELLKPALLALLKSKNIWILMYLEKRDEKYCELVNLCLKGDEILEGEDKFIQIFTISEEEI